MSHPVIPLILQRPAFDAITSVGMLLLVITMSAAWIVVLRKRSARAALWAAVAIGLMLVANVAGDLTGVFSRLDLQPPPFVLLVLLGLGLVVAVGLGYAGKVGDVLVRTMPVEAMVALQIFRFPLEMLMLRAASLGIMPKEFSLLGYNLDALTGLGALAISLYCAWTWRLPLRVIWLWNIFGIACLLAIGILAALTSPNIRAFGASPERINSWVLYFPYSMLPTLLVVYAVFGHVLLTRKLLTQQHLLPPLRWPSLRKAANDPW